MQLCQENFTILDNGDNPANIPSIIKNGILNEDVSCINGLCIPAIYEYQTTSEMTMYTVLATNLQKDVYLQEKFNHVVFPCTSINDYIYLTIVYSSSLEKLYNKIAQIPRYDWLTSSTIKICHDNMKKHVSKSCRYEYNIKIERYNSYYGDIDIIGIIDAIDDTTIWEFKCVDDITLEHYIQLIVYAFMWNVSTNVKEFGCRKFKIMNIRNGKVCEYNYNHKITCKIMNILFKSKFQENITKNNEEFIISCIKNNYLQTNIL